MKEKLMEYIVSLCTLWYNNAGNCFHSTLEAYLSLQETLLEITLQCLRSNVFEYHFQYLKQVEPTCYVWWIIVHT